MKKAQPDSPTAFELAQLAATLCPGKRNPTAIDSAAHEAWQLWESCNRIVQHRETARQQIRELRTGLYTMTPEEWTQRMDSFCGTQAELTSALESIECDAETVRRELFRDKNDGRTQRKSKWGTLPELALRHGIPVPGHKYSGDELAKFVDTFVLPNWDNERLGWVEIRWAVAARQLQIAQRKKRD